MKNPYHLYPFLLATIIMMGTASAAGIVTNANEATLGAIADVKTANADLVFVETAYGDTVFMGERWSAGLHLVLPDDEQLPVDIVIFDIGVVTTSATRTPCGVDPDSYIVELPNGASVYPSADGKIEFRLYPTIYAGIDAPRGNALHQGVGTTSDAIFKMQGLMGVNTGAIDEPLACTAQVDVQATELGGLDTSTLNDIGMGLLGFPKISEPLPTGLMKGTENKDGNKGTVTLANYLPTSADLPFTVFGSEPSGQVTLSIKVSFTETDSNAHDDDYLEVWWDNKPKLWVDSLETYNSNPKTISNGGLEEYCVNGVVRDEDWERSGNSGNADEVIGRLEEPVCWHIAYVQLTDGKMELPDVELSQVCELVAESVVRSSVVALDEFTNCKDEQQADAGLLNAFSGYDLSDRDRQLGYVPGYVIILPGQGAGIQVPPYYFGE